MKKGRDELVGDIIVLDVVYDRNDTTIRKDYYGFKDFDGI